jgi:hypothetical protein
MAVEFYKSAVAVMVKADDPTQVRVLPVAMLPEYEEWHIHSDVTEIGKDGIPTDGTMKAITLPANQVREKVEIEYDAPTGKVVGEVLVSIPSVCLMRVEVSDDATVDVFASKSAEKLDGAKMDALIAEKPVFSEKFTDMPTVEEKPIIELVDESAIGG